jgi:hypothetical protein
MTFGESMFLDGGVHGIKAFFLCLRETAMRQLHELQPVPSVGMHDVPRESVGQHLGFGLDEENGRDSLDASVARESNMMPYNPYADCQSRTCSVRV